MDMKVFYGIKNKMRDVSEICFKKCKVSENTYFIGNNKNILFGDRHVFIVKDIEIIFNENTYSFSENECIIFYENVLYSYQPPHFNAENKSKIIEIKISYSSDNFNVKTLLINDETLTSLININEHNIQKMVQFINEKKIISYETKDNYFLLFYGQLRTFEKCIPNMLIFLKYSVIRYDVYLMLDKTNDPNFTDEKFELLLSMFNKNNVKKIWFIQEHTDEKIEEEKVKNYYKICDKIKKEIHPDIVSDYFVSKLYHRRLLTLNVFKNYCTENNLNYKYGVFTRFDINLKNQLENNLMYNHEYKLYISFDVLYIGSLNQLLELFNFSNNYFAIYDYHEKHDRTELAIFLKKNNMIHELNHDYGFIRSWIAMPEANFEFYVKYNNIEHVKLRYGYIIQR